jgi:hypothetical protein
MDWEVLALRIVLILTIIYGGICAYFSIRMICDDFPDFIRDKKFERGCRTKLKEINLKDRRNKK